MEDNLAAIRRLGVRYEDVTAQHDAVAGALRLATNRYREGYSPYLEQLDAQRGLLTAELSVIQVRAEQLNAFVALYQAMGGGWSQDEIVRQSAR